MRENNEESMYLSVLTFCEIAKGIEKASNPAKKKALQMWLENELKERFKHRILDVDMAVASQWGTIQGKVELVGKPMPTIDGLIAVSGLVHNCVVVTRNISDMQQSGVELLNPWE
jgi:predicted nucleic acid-binding protein